MNRRCHHYLGLRRIRPDVPDGGMATGMVVLRFNIPKKNLTQSVGVHHSPTMDAIAIQAAENDIHHCIIESIALVAHAATPAVARYQVAVV